MKLSCVGECELDSYKVPQTSQRICDSKMNITGNGENIFPHLFPRWCDFSFRAKHSLSQIMCLWTGRILTVFCLFWMWF